MSGTDEQESPSSATELVTLVVRAQDGDLASFEGLVERFEGRLFGMAYRMLGNRLDAEDTVQETFIKVWSKLGDLRHPEAFSTWLYRQAANHCQDTLRSRAAQATAPVDAGYMEETLGDARQQDPARQVEAASSMDALAALLQELPQEQRLCWVLRELQGLSYQEISDSLDVTGATVRGRLARARKALAEGMGDWR
ncbi:RNA polymerase sigma factor [Rothia halotolerans]|uniref:RNA polymerase sigma factor n=1 Tax=Rothia halotolerans TaxID=405770 RepID=UPI0013EC96B7|nr:sigma-70 family RNA polymerase sigma factor [Rothia halotolerans]